MERFFQNNKVLIVALIVSTLGVVFFYNNSATFFDLKNYNTHVEELGGDLDPIQSQNPNSLKKSKNIRDAYTGQWFKNDRIESKNATQSFEFKNPENTRNNLAAEQNKKEKKKKKKTAKKNKKPTVYKFSKSQTGNLGPSLFESNIEDNSGVQIVSRFIKNNRKKPTPNEEKILSIDEWVELLKKNEGFAKLISEVNSGKVSRNDFFQIIDKLMQSPEKQHNQTAYRLLATNPDLEKFAKHVTYLSQEQEQDLRDFSTTLLNSYKLNQNFRILVAALNNESSLIKTQANILIRETVEGLIASLQENDTELIARTPSSANQYISILQTSLSVYDSLLSSGALAPELTSDFSTTRTLIQRFFSLQQPQFDGQ